jgi:hypothetical protein
LNVADTGVFAVDVVIEKFPDPSAGAGSPPVLVKLNEPVPPTVVFRITRLPIPVFVKVHVTEALAIADRVMVAVAAL